MKRNTTRLASALLAVSAVTLGPLVACSSAPSEGVEKTNQAFVYDLHEEYDQGTFPAMVNLAADPANAKVSVTENVLTFTPSPTGAQHNMKASTVTIPSTSYDTGGICGSATLDVTNATLASPLAITLGTSTIDLDVTITGSATVHTGTIFCPNPTFAFANAPVHVSLAAVNGLLVASSAQLTLTGHTTPSCGLLGWCSGLMASSVVTLQNNVNGALMTALSKALLPVAPTAPPGLQWTIDNALLQAESLRDKVSGTMVPGSLAIANGVLSNDITYNALPPALTCSGTDSCVAGGGGYLTGAGQSTITCNSVPYGGSWSIQLERENAAGQFQVVQTQTLTTPGVGTTLYDPYTPAVSQTSFTYRVCSLDSVGTNCGPPFVVNAVASCSNCDLLTCSDVLKCGTAPDGCGGTLNCGTCATGEYCTSNNQCCPTGEVWNPGTNSCGSVSCTTPACICRGAGGTWVGGTCR